MFFKAQENHHPRILLEDQHQENPIKIKDFNRNDLLSVGFTEEQLNKLSPTISNYFLFLMDPILNTNEAPILDSEGNLVNRMNILFRRGFTPEQLIELGTSVKVKSKKNPRPIVGIQVLSHLLVLEKDKDGNVLWSVGGFPKTKLCKVLQAGFTPDQLTTISTKCANKYNLIALYALVTAPCQENSFGYGEPSPALTVTIDQYLQAGITRDDLAQILSSVGSTNTLITMEKLLQPWFNVSTLVEYFISLKFTLNDLIKISSKDGGGKSLQALIDLITPRNNVLESADFKLLIDAGFTVQHLVKIMTHDGGSKNLEALLLLLKPLPEAYQPYNEPVTSLQLLMQADFTKDNIVHVLDSDGGSKNLKALLSCIIPLKDKANQFQYDAQNYVINGLQLLKQNKVDSLTATQILNGTGGAKNFKALQCFLANRDNYTFLQETAGGIQAITTLLKHNARAPHLRLLEKLIENVEYRQYLGQPTHLATLCFNLRNINCTKLNMLEVKSLSDLQALCANRTKRSNQEQKKEQPSKKTKTTNRLKDSIQWFKTQQPQTNRQDQSQSVTNNSPC